MKKVIVASLMLVFITSCSFFGFNKEKSTYVKVCPNVVIPRHSSYLTQVGQGFDDFQISVVGYEGYCYYNQSIKSYKAVITPLFEVVKLTNTKDTEIDFRFFIKTPVGAPEYVGKMTYMQSAFMSKKYKKMQFKGKTVEVRLPLENKENFEMTLGLVQTLEEVKFNNKTFDIEYDYIEEQ